MKLYKKEIRAVWQEVGDQHFILGRKPVSDWVDEDKEEELKEKYKPEPEAWYYLEIESRYVPIKEGDKANDKKKEEAKEYLYKISYDIGSTAMDYLSDKDGIKMRESIDILYSEEG